MDGERNNLQETEHRKNALEAFTINGKECTREEYEQSLNAIDQLQNKYGDTLYQVKVVPSQRRDTAPHYKEGQSPDTKRMIFFRHHATNAATDVAPYDLSHLQDEKWLLCIADKINAVPNNPDKGSVEVVPFQDVQILRKWTVTDDDMLHIGNIKAPRVHYVENKGKYATNSGDSLDFFKTPQLLDQIGLPPSIYNHVRASLESYQHALAKAEAAIQWPSQQGEVPYNDGTLQGIIKTTTEYSYGGFRKVSLFQCPQVPNGVIKHEELLFYSEELSKPDSIEKIKQVFALWGRPDKVTVAMTSSHPSINCSWGQITEACSVDALMSDPTFTATLQESERSQHVDDNSQEYRYTITINSDTTGSIELKDILYREALHPYSPLVIKAHVGAAAYKLAGDQIEQHLKSQIRRRPLKEYELKFRERSVEHHEQIDNNVPRKPYEHNFVGAIHSIEHILAHPPKYASWETIEEDYDSESTDGMRGSGRTTVRNIQVSGYVFGKFRMRCPYISDSPAEVKKTLLSSLLADIEPYIKQLDEDALTHVSYTTPIGNHTVTPDVWYAGPEPELSNTDEYQKRKRGIDARFAAIQDKWRTMYLPAAKYVEDMASEDTRVIIENKEALLVTIQHITEELPNLKKSPIGIYGSVDIDNLLQELKNKMQPFIDDKPAFLSVAEGLLTELQAFKDQTDRMRSLRDITNKCNEMFREQQTSPTFVIEFQKIFSKYSSDPLKKAFVDYLKPGETIEDRIAYLLKQTRDKLSSSLNLDLPEDSDINLIEKMGDYLYGIEISKSMLDQWTTLLLEKSQDPMLGKSGNTFDGMNIVFHAEYMHDPYNVKGTRNDGTQNYVLLGESIAINSDTGAEFPFASVQFIMNQGSRYYHDIIIDLDPYHSPVTFLPDNIQYRSKNVIKGPSYPLLTGDTTQITVTPEQQLLLRKAREAMSIFEGNVSIKEKQQDKKLQDSSRQPPQAPLLNYEELEELGIPIKTLPSKEITFDALTVEQAARLLDTPLDELPQFLDGSIEHLHFQNARQFTEALFEDIALSAINTEAISATITSLNSIKKELFDATNTPDKSKLIDRLEALQAEYKRRWTAIQAPGQLSQELKTAGFDIKDREIRKIIVIACYHQLSAGVESLRTLLPEIIHAAKNTLLLNKALQYAIDTGLIINENTDRMKRSITDIIAASPNLYSLNVDDIELLALYALDEMNKI